MKSQARNTEGPRVQEILNLIYELASGNLVARGTVSENNDYLDGIITGINMLADEIAQDITGRKQAEGVLKESEEKFSRAFHSNPHPMSIVTMAEGRYLDVNDSYVQTFGFSREELLGRTTVEMGIVKNDRARRKILQSLKERQAIKNLEVEFHTRSGRKVEALLSADKTEIGGQTCLLSVLTDITERKRVEEALRESEERFSQLYNESPVGYHESDSEGRIIQVNQTELDMLGYTAEEMLGRHVWDFRVETDTSRQAFAAKMAGTMPPGQAFERTYRRKDGTTFPALLEGRYVKDESGQIIGLRSTIQDITERKQAEGVLKESEEKFSRAFHSNPHPMSIVTMAEGRYLDVNDSYVQTFGFSREELLGRTTVEMGILKNDRSRRKILQSLKERQTVKNLEVELYTRSGRKVDALLSGDKIEIGGQACLLSVLTNITERKQAEEKREQLIQELQETLKEVRTLSGLLPICAWCKKLRDDEGYWKSVEQYIGERTKAEFTHGMCPECQSKFLSERNSNTKVS